MPIFRFLYRILADPIIHPLAENKYKIIFKPLKNNLTSFGGSPFNESCLVHIGIGGLRSYI